MVRLRGCGGCQALPRWGDLPHHFSLLSNFTPTCLLRGVVCWSLLQQFCVLSKQAQGGKAAVASPDVWPYLARG